jgi:hypothetical protein
VLVFIRDEGKHSVDVEEGPLIKLSFAEWTAAHATGGPVPPDAGLGKERGSHVTWQDYNIGELTTSPNHSPLLLNGD